MSFVIQKRPKQYSAVLQPIIYIGQRQDQAFNTVTNNAGTIRVTVNTIDVTANYTVGDQVYVKSTDGRYDALGLVTARAFGANTTIDVGITYTSNATVGFINNITKRPVYKIRVNYKDPVTNANLVTNSLDFAANTKGIVTIDARIVGTLIGPQIDSIAPYLVATTDTLRSIQFYIGYTERWTGSANSETNDTSFPKYAIFGDAEVNGFNDYLRRIPGRFLSVSSKLRAWIGKYFDLSYFGLDSTYSISTEHYAADGSLTATDTAITGAAGVYRLPILPATTDRRILAKVLQAITIPAGTGWLDYSGGTAFTKNTSTLVAVATTGSLNYRALTPIPNIDLTNFSAINFSLTLTGTWTGSISLTIRLTNKTSTSYKQFFVSGLTANGTTPASITTATATGIFPEIYTDSLIVTLGGSVASGTVTATLTIPNGQVITTILSTQDIEVQEPCTKPVTLSWINRLGGQDWWTFDYNQDLSYTTGDGQRIRRMRLTASDLTYDQWQMVNYINQPGDVYQQSYSELTTAVRGKQKRLGAQAYLLLDDYTLLEVVAIFTSQSTATDSLAHAVDVTIEFPEGFEENNFFGVATGRLRPFIVNFTNNLPTNEWEVYWFGSVLQKATTTASYIKNLQLPTEPVDVVIKVRKKSNNGIAQLSGTISLIKNTTVYPGQNISFSAGDDMSDLTFIIYNVDGSGTPGFDQMRVTIVE